MTMIELVVFVIASALVVAGQVAPKIQPITAPKDVMAGETVRLFCALAKGSAPVRFDWLFDDQPIVLQDGITSESMSTHSNLLQFEAIKADHSGNYSCLAKNDIGQDSTSAFVEVKGSNLLSA
jgi:Down syndrome cell adhesion protein 1